MSSGIPRRSMILQQHVKEGGRGWGEGYIDRSLRDYLYILLPVPHPAVTTAMSFPVRRLCLASKLPRCFRLVVAEERTWFISTLQPACLASRNDSCMTPCTKRTTSSLSSTPERREKHLWLTRGTMLPIITGCCRGGGDLLLSPKETGGTS